MNLLRWSSPSGLARPHSSSHGSPAVHRLHFRPTSYASFSPSSPLGAREQPPRPRSRIPARDRLMEFGKHKGRMLGALPSAYLAWISKNLRARDYEEWARLADEVLGDPVYQDRLEWEAAERVLTGVGRGAASSSSPMESPVAELLDISQRFGWDNEDKEGWRRVDFRLLGTSKGGRIPRLPKNNGALPDRKALQFGSRTHGGASEAGFLGVDSSIRRRQVMGNPGMTRLGKINELGSSRRGPEDRCYPDADNSCAQHYASPAEPVFTDKNCRVHEARKAETLGGGNVGYRRKGLRFAAVEDEEEHGAAVESAVKEKREERRERRRLRREQQMRTLRREVGGDRAVAGGQTRERSGGCSSSNPFPGRGALLAKVGGRDAV